LPAFSWNQICGEVLRWPSFNSYFDDLFCRGIDPDVDTGECHWHPEVPDRWPSLAETIYYRDRVRDAVLDSVEALGYCRSDDIMGQGGRVLQMVLEHEYMHQETLLYMMQRLPIAQKIRPRAPLRYFFQPWRASPISAHPKRSSAFGRQFSMNCASVGTTNSIRSSSTCRRSPSTLCPSPTGQFSEFVTSGAYDDPRLLAAGGLAAGRIWKISATPSCWVEQADGWFYRSMFDVFPLGQVASWPVYVSLAEARALRHVAR
jgi:hypothetical protein